MVPGNTITLTIGRQTVAGVAAPDLVLADFAITAALDGADVSGSIAPDVTYVGLDQTGLWGLYSLAITLPSSSGFFECWADAASGTDIIRDGDISGEIEAYDLDSLAALLLMSQGQPGVQSAADSDLGDIVAGDSYQSATMTVPAGKLSPFGISDITTGGRISIEASIKSVPADTAIPITATVVSGPGLTYNFGWTADPMPSLGTETSKPYFIDVQIIRAAITGSPKIICTVGRFSLTRVWERETRTT